MCCASLLFVGLLWSDLIYFCPPLARMAVNRKESLSAPSFASSSVGARDELTRATIRDSKAAGPCRKQSQSAKPRRGIFEKEKNDRISQ